MQELFFSYLKIVETGGGAVIYGRLYIKYSAFLLTFIVTLE
jgi:hypothetical protein